MQMLILFNADNRPFSAEEIHNVFWSEKGFREVRLNAPGGTAIEADYVDGEDSTIVRLDDDLQSLSLSGESDAALDAALILQKQLQAPLRIIDLDYAFDLVLSEFKDRHALRTAMINAQAH